MTSSDMIPLSSVIVMVLGLVGMVLRRHNMISFILCLELMLLGAQTYGVWLAHALHQQAFQAWVLVVIVIAAVEMALSLAIFIMLYQRSNSIDSDHYTQLKE